MFICVFQNQKDNLFYYQCLNIYFWWFKKIILENQDYLLVLRDNNTDDFRFINLNLNHFSSIRIPEITEEIEKLIDTEYFCMTM